MTNKHLMLILVVSLLGLSAKAQPKNNSENTESISEPSYLMFRYSSKNFVRNEDRGTIGLQYIKGLKNQKAVRFGVELNSNYFTQHEWTPLNSDTNQHHIKTYMNTLVKASMGIEWRKQLHKDVILYAGIDGMLGIGVTNYYSNVYAYRNDGTYIENYSPFIYSKHMAIQAGVRPFSGIRANWNRFAIGYEAGLPLQYTYIPSLQTGRFQNIKVQHTLSIGLRLKK